MSYIALYRKFRPLVFKDVVEQQSIVKTLRNTITSGRIGHAYLFCGTRGTGKTTMAKIFARAVNCLNSMDGDPCNQCEICTGILNGSILDVIEIDAASNNSVDDVRDIRNEVVYTPSQAKYKVYIIDEVHMLSTGAFNALLKTLEEPPPHVIFILATTEPHKLPATILSRCQRYNFKRISIESIADLLSHIATKSNVALENTAALYIAKLAEGAMRDGINILDQCIALGNSKLTYEDVMSVVGGVDNSFLIQMIDYINSSDIKGALLLVQQVISDGKDVSKFLTDLILYYRNILIIKLTENTDNIIDLPLDQLNKITAQAEAVTQDEITCFIRELSLSEASIKWSSQPRIVLEVTLIRICQRIFSQQNQGLLDRISILEGKLNHLITNGVSLATTKTASESLPTTNSVENSMNLPKDSKSSTASENAVNKSTAESPKTLSGSPVEFWSEVIEDLRKLGKMVLYSNLIDSKAYLMSDKVVGIKLPESNSFGKVLIPRAENQEIIEAALSKKFSREVKIKLIEDIISTTKQDQPNNDPSLERIRDLAAKHNVPINIINE